MRAVLVLALIACKGDPPASATTTTTTTTVATSAPAKRTATVRVDRRVELVSIVQRLAGGKEYTQAPASSPYVQAVDAWFTPFASHAAVADAIMDRRMFGVSFDAPMVLAVHLDDQLALRNPAELPVLDPRFEAIDVVKRAANLEDFARAAKLDAFLASQAAHVAGVESQMRAVIEREDPVRWFDGVFGPAPATFFVVPALLAGTMNYGPRVTLPDGTMELYQLLSVTGRDGTLEPNEQLVALLVHEMAHSYINPVFATHRAQLEPSESKVFALVAREMAAQAYKDPLTMVNEAGVRATVVMYMRERKGEIAGAAAMRAELGHSFVWMPELVDVMQRFRRGARHDLDAFMPEVIAFWDQLAARYTATGLPAIPFLGPVDAVYGSEPVWIEPAGGDAKLVQYVRGIQQGLRPNAVRVTASARTLDEQRGHDVVAFGSPATNPVIAAVATAAHWNIASNGITLGARTFTGPRLVLVACWPVPGDPAHGTAIYGAADEADLVGLNSRVRHGERDWLVARRLASGDYEVIASGDFVRGSDGAWLPPT